MENRGALIRTSQDLRAALACGIRVPYSQTVSATFEYDVFLSHRSTDKPVVCELAEPLRFIR